MRCCLQGSMLSSCQCSPWISRPQRARLGVHLILPFTWEDIPKGVQVVVMEGKAEERYSWQS